MAGIELGAPLLEAGIRNTHFFNGRLLTAEDLLNEQDANRAQHRQLGRTLGAGVAAGFEVTMGAQGLPRPSVRVQPGLAVNRRGQAVEVSQAAGSVEVMLTKAPVTPVAPASEGRFVVCALPEAEPVFTGGVFVFVVAPATGFEGHSLGSGFGAGSQGSRCGSQYTVEGVQFRLVPLDVSDQAPVAACPDLGDVLPPQTPADRVMLRNLLAHRCFGTEELAAFPGDPFTARPQYGALDDLRTRGLLTDDEVPLALVYLTGERLEFVDMWAVRCPAISPFTSEAWPLHVGQRRLVEGQAAFLQFQQQIAALPGLGINLAQIAVRDYFRYLPAAGFLPLPLEQTTFFDGLQIINSDLDGAFLRRSLFESWLVDAIDLCAPPPLRICQLAEDPAYLIFLRDQASRLVP